MPKTFWADCVVTPRYNQDTSRYVEEQWQVCLYANSEEDLKHQELKANLLGITVRDYPEIMSKIEQAGYFRTSPAIWLVKRISEPGITFELHSYGGISEDGTDDLWEQVFIFVPMSNVIAIHNVSERFLINESVSSMGSKE